MNQIKQYLKARRGSLTTVFGFSLGAITLGMGVAYDLNGMVSQSQDVQHLADMAVLAASSSEKRTEWELQAIAENMVNGNASGTHSYNTVLTLNEDRSMRVDVSTEHEFLFMKRLGHTDKTVTRSATSLPIGIGKLDIALVVDITDTTPGGLVGEVVGTVNDVVDTVDNALIDTLDANVIGLAEDLTDVRISVVPFSQYVKIPTHHAGEPWLDIDSEDDWEGCMGSRSAPWNKRARWGHTPLHGFSSGGDCENEVQPLTEDLRAVKNALLAVNTNDNTYMPAGLIWGWRTLSRDVPFTEADTPDYHERNRIMLLISDGGLTKSLGGSGPEDFDGEMHDGDDHLAANRLSADICQNIKDEGIIIYAVAVNIDDETTLNLLRNCATDPAKLLEAADDIALDLLLGQFRKDLSHVRLSG